MSEPFPAIEPVLEPGIFLVDLERLDTLIRSELLDTPAEEVFDRGVRLATKLLGTRVALLSLVDADRQFFKAHEGLPEPYSQTRETPLSHSFCKHVVASGEILKIEDARTHPLVRDNLAIPDLGVIAYLGVPIVAANGHVLGSFCAIDPKPRKWSRDDVDALCTIAKGVESEIRLRAEVKHSRALQQTSDEGRARLALVLESTSDGIVSIDHEKTIIFANRAAGEILGQLPSLTGRPLFEVFPRGEGEAFVEMVETALKSGKPSEAMVRARRSGRWIEARAATSGGGEVTLFFRDVMARQMAQESRALLVRELHHRIKNLFAIVRGMITMTARGATDPKQMAQALEERLIGLGRTQDLILPAPSGNDVSNYQDVVLTDLIKTLIAPYSNCDGESSAIDGPLLLLGINSATHFALFVNELATNASKYGALSHPAGRLRIDWAIDGDTLVFRWTESGSIEPSVAPIKRSFGSRLIQLCIEVHLEGKLELELQRPNIYMQARIPTKSLTR